MPFNGTGTFVSIAPPDYPAVAGTTIRAAQFNANLTDIFGGFNNCLTRDGQGRPGANIDWAGFNLTNVGTFGAGAAQLTSGNLTFASTGQRIVGDMSSATITNRLMFQTSTVNSATSVSVIPAGTAATAQFVAFNNSVPTNASTIAIGVGAASTYLLSGITGTGSYLPLTFLTNSLERMRIDTSGNAGIGTAAPTNRLHVYDASSNTAMFESGGIVATVNLVGTAGSAAIATASGDLVLQADPLNAEASSDIRFNIDGSETARIDSSGRLGIGTASPDGKLTVYDPVDRSLTATDFQFRIGGNGYSAHLALNATSFQIGHNSASRSLTFHTGAGMPERVRITAAGDVGIGVPVPSAKLHVGGRLAVRPGADTVFDFGATSAGANYGVWRKVDNSTGAYIGFDGGAIHSGGTGLNFGVRSEADLFFMSGAAESMRIDASGRVGIGVSPSYPLHVYRSQNSETQFRVANPNTGAAAYAGVWAVSDVVSMRMAASGNAAGASASIGTESAHSVSFRTSGVERFQLNTSGYLLNTANTHPFFMYRGSGNITSASGTVILGTVAANQAQFGSSYNTSTGVFTAPVAGVYQFSANVVFQNSSGVGIKPIINFYILRSAVVYQSVTDIRPIANGDNCGLSLNTVVYLTAGDTVRVIYGNVTLAAGLYIQGTASTFSGVLLH